MPAGRKGSAQRHNCFLRKRLASDCGKNHPDPKIPTSLRALRYSLRGFSPKEFKMRWCLALATALFLLPASCATYSFVAQEGPDITLRLDPDGRVPTYNDGKLGLSIVPETSDGHLALRISVS